MVNDHSKETFKKLASTIKTPHFFDAELEGLRGFAALGVMFYHGVGTRGLDVAYKPEGFLAYLSLSGLGVYLFFVLSGYVIGINYQNRSTFKTGLYLKKRLVRLYPLYLISFLSILVLATPTLFQIVGDILMLQNDNIWAVNWPRVIDYLGPIWSINYEIIFYCLFPFIVFIRPRTTLFFALLLVCAVIGYYGYLIPFYLSDYCNGLLFWILGLFVAWKLPQIKKTKFNFLSYIFLIFCYNHIVPGTIILRGLHIDTKLVDLIGPHSLGLKTLAYIPLCFLVIADLAKRNIPFRKVLFFAVYLLPLVVFLYLIFTNRLFESVRWVTCIVWYIIALVTIKETRLSGWVLKKLQFTGSISYALYLFHMPLAFIIQKYFPYNGSLTAYYYKLIIWLILTYLLAYLGEHIIQPKIKSLFFKNARAPLPVLSKAS